ncbi:hypothetical protein V6N12_052322 [Hibiscus sabdariffa]|uniref:Uncharacterized protein n=1 Tax=Hibiscus sabdariffa TaxID=183260 RepID=A0ABR2GIN6_9ROSI
MLHVVYRVGNLEKTINSADYGVDKYDIRIGFGHFGIAVDDPTMTDRRKDVQHFSICVDSVEEQLFTNLDTCRASTLRLPLAWTPMAGNQSFLITLSDQISLLIESREKFIAVLLFRCCLLPSFFGFGPKKLIFTAN